MDRRSAGAIFAPAHRGLATTDDPINRERAGTFDNEHDENRHPEQTLIENDTIGQAIEPCAECAFVFYAAMTVKIGKALNDNETDHADGRYAGE